MQCLIHIPGSVHYYQPKRGPRTRQKVVLTQTLQTTVYHLRLPARQNEEEPFVWVDAWIPEDRRGAIPILDDAWVEPGVYRTKAVIKENRWTLAPFLDSGMTEMNVRETG